MDAVSEELEGQSRYLSSLIQRSKIKSKSEEAKEKGKSKEMEKEKNADLDKELMKNLKVRAADIAPVMQRRAFRRAHEVIKEMNKLDSKKLALALKRAGLEDMDQIFQLEK